MAKLSNVTLLISQKWFKMSKDRKYHLKYLNFIVKTVITLCLPSRYAVQYYKLM